MKNVFKLFGVIALAAITGFSMAACGGDDDGDVPPENKPVAERWGKWIAPTATATLDYSVADDGVCTIIIGGTAQPNNESDGWGRWKANAQYEYTAKAGKSFIYTFEAWTQSGARVVNFQYCNVEANNIYLEEEISLTTTRRTYTINGKPIAEGSLNHVEFQGADRLGTFYVKILEIKEVGSSSGGGGGSLAGTTWIGEKGDKITFTSGKDVVYDETFLKGITGTYTISGDRVNVNYKGTTFGINYNENWVYSLSGNTLTIVSATGNPNLLQEPRVGYKYTKQQ